ncbi:MAG: hypothetical protein BWY11_01384 [Firmicutes bacterium ADurb.Bin182]|nr:MAG: hypothetical protein BWY11_01384 [Firmicutes bacterium ADurb.Bin182]
MRKKNRLIISVIALILLLGFVISLIFGVIYWVL